MIPSLPAFDIVHFNLQVILDPSLLSVCPSFSHYLSPFLPPWVLSCLHSISDMETDIPMTKFFRVEGTYGWGGVGVLEMICRLFNTCIITSSSMVRLLSARQSLQYFFQTALTTLIAE